MADPSVHQVSLACGVDGAWVDCSDDVRTESPVQGRWGRVSDFDDTRPGVFSFDLDNGDGKYAPKNAASSLDTPVHRGMGVAHFVDGLKRSGTIRSAQPYFIDDFASAGSSLVRVMCDDMLGNAARHDIGGDLALDLWRAAGGFLRWPLDDAAGTEVGHEENGVQPIFLRSGADGTNTFGVVSDIPAPSVLEVKSVSTNFPLQVGDFTFGAFNGGPLPNFVYGTETMGAVGFWLESPAAGLISLNWVTNSGISATVSVSAAGVLSMTTAGGATPAMSSALAAGRAYYVSVSSATTFAAGVWTVVFTLWVDGVNIGTSTSSTTPAALPDSSRSIRSIYVNNATNSTYRLANLTHSLSRIDETGVNETTAAARLECLVATTPDVTLDTLPTLASAILAEAGVLRTTLDAFNDVIRTEQGYIWSETTGPITAPVQKIKVRARDRGETVDAAHTFSVDEIDRAPEFVTDIANMVSEATANGPVASQTAVDPDLIPDVGSASDSQGVLLRDSPDLKAWAEDRIIRGAVDELRVAQFTLDALSIDRWSDIVALRPGDRVRIGDLPLEQLGVDYIDGWLLGGSYSLSFPDRMLFTFYMQPALPATAKYGSNKYMAGGALTLSAAIVSPSATTMSVATTGPKLSTTAVPYDLLIDDEQVTVTACNSATPQVATITRGVNGTTAATHTTAATIELAERSRYAF